MKKSLLAITLIGATSATAFAFSRLRIQTVDQLPATLESITNVSSREPDIEKYFADKRDAFPKIGVLDEVSVAQLSGQLSYAGLYCRKMIERDSGKAPADRWAHAAITFGSAPSDWPPDALDKQLDQYAQMFWQREVDADERALLRGFAADLVAELPREPASSVALLTSLCGIYATSFRALSQ
jgi:hypothetical protein